MIPPLSAAADTLYLHQNWQFAREGTAEWRPASVPGTVHLDLQRLNLIPDPYFATQEKDVQWVEKENWLYRTRFQAPPAAAGEKVELVFEGLDTYAEVTLNGAPLLKTDNMFRSWRVEVGHLLQADGNLLEIRFISPLTYHQNRPDGPRYHLTAGNEASDTKVSVYTRKAPFQFGWDWGPRIVTCGVWKPVYLERSTGPRLRHLRIESLHVSEKTAHVRVQASTDTLPLTFRIRDAEMGYVLSEQPVEQGQAQGDIYLVNPRLWWVHTFGEPYRYHWILELVQNGQIIESRDIRYGIRHIELVQDRDSIGRAFYFKLNGAPLFAKGANMIPFDARQPHANRDEYRAVLQDAKAVHMNMIRVWGGGVYPSDDFYDLCDSLGILVWQDFMFACSMYPADPAFAENVRLEAEEQLSRLHRFASIAIWCGNNEVDVAWHNWGWQIRFGIIGKEAETMKAAYQTLFHQILPQAVSRYEGQIYTHTSPLSNWGKIENFNEGTMHYWGVWHGKDPLEKYAYYIGRYMNEYGFQSFPAMPTIRRFAPQESDWSLQSEVMRWHQKSYIGNGEIQNQLLDHFSPPADFADFVYKSQLTQLEGMRIAISSHRRNKGRCMGTLYWQLNDCWPGPSWSGRDYYGDWKALHFGLRHLYAPVLIAPEVRDKKLEIIVVSDQLSPLEGNVVVEAFALDGKFLSRDSFFIRIPSNSRSAAVSLSVKKLDPQNTFLLCRFGEAETLVYLAPAKDLRLPVPALDIRHDPETQTLTLTSPTLIRGLYLEGRFSDNYFDLLPGRPKTIRYEGEAPETWRWTSLNPRG